MPGNISEICETRFIDLKNHQTVSKMKPEFLVSFDFSQQTFKSLNLKKVTISDLLRLLTGKPSSVKGRRLEILRVQVN